MVKRTPSRGARQAQDMARRAGFETEVQYELVESDLPEGYESVEGPTGGGFFNFEAVGQQIRGTLLATTIIETEREVINPDTKKKEKVTEAVARWQFLIDGASDAVILPNHYDLVERLQKLENNMGLTLPVRSVVIQYRGQQAARTRSGFIHRYAVGVDRGAQQALTGGDQPQPQA